MTNAEKKSWGARLGHIKRRLNNDEPLTGNHLALALDVIGNGNSRDSLVNEIARKLKAGQKLDPYERHLMVGVFLLHARFTS